MLGRANRVMVIGCSGGGKTTLALRLSDKFGFEYLSIDRDVYWLPGWQIREQADQRAILARLVSGERWIMDGNNSSSFDLRVPRADLILWLRPSRLTAFKGLARRVAANYGRTRIAMAQGCPEPLPDRDFLSYIWNFEKKTGPRFVEQIDMHGPGVPTLVVRSRREAAHLVP